MIPSMSYPLSFLRTGYSRAHHRCDGLSNAPPRGDGVETVDADDSSGGRQKSGALDEITVLAQRTTLEIARKAEQEAPTHQSHDAEEMQKLPMSTQAKRSAGSGNLFGDDTGEGRYINIRVGCGLEQHHVCGLRLPPTKTFAVGGGRAVAFDSIPVVSSAPSR